jgi:hypothetical protein
MVLLTLLAVNTFACSTGRVLKMFGQCDRNRNKFRFFLNFGPHVMHYAVLVILLGYLGSYALSVAMPGRSLAPGGLPMKLPGGLGEVRLEKLNPEVYEGKRLAFFENWYLDPGYDLIHTDPKGKETRKRFAYSRSPSFAGYRFYLYDFYPKRSTGGSMGLNYTKISIRKDPSSLVYVGGLALFFLGLLMYAADIFLKWRRRREPAVAGPGAGDDRGHDAPAPGSDPLADSVDPTAPVPEKRKEAGTGA